METDSFTKGPLFKPLPEKRAFKEIEKQIRQLIYSRTLKPGDKLPSEKELASQFKVGRISVREALRTLEQAGLILIKQGSTGGSYVRELDATVATESMSDLMWQGDIHIRDLTDARLSIEKLILEKAFDKITEDELSALDASVQELEALAVEGRREEYPIDPTLTNFHIVLAQATNNPVFPIILRVLIDVTARVIKPPTTRLERLRKHALSHRSIFEALRDRDLAGAARAMEEHMLEVESRYMHMLGRGNREKA